MKTEAVRPTTKRPQTSAARSRTNRIIGLLAHLNARQDDHEWGNTALCEAVDLLVPDADMAQAVANEMLAQMVNADPFEPGNLRLLAHVIHERDLRF